MQNNIENFKTSMQAAGLTPPEIIIDDGLIHRFSNNGKHGDQSGWYVLYADGIAAGSFGDWRLGIKQTWCSKADKVMSESERQAHRAHITHKSVI